MNNVEMNELLIYRNLLQDEIVAALILPKELTNSQLYGSLLQKAEQYGLKGNLPVEYVLYVISHQENIFSLTAEKNGGVIGKGLRKTVQGDILILRGFIKGLAMHYAKDPLIGAYEPTNKRESKGHTLLEKCFLKFASDSSAEKAVKLLCDYYDKYGYGIMTDNVAFNWDGDKGILTGIRNYSTTTFADIYGYDYQKDELQRNTEAFIHDKPANNVLLFGDRGCGKSSSIKAVGNAYYSAGLRMVQVSREYFVQLPKLMQELSKWGKNLS